MYSVYILYSAKLNRYYVGHTIDIANRLKQHNSGQSEYTSKANDWELKWSESFATRDLAQKREREIKKKKSRVYIDNLIKG